MNPEELFHTIKKRRAVMPSFYSGQNISKEELNLILESANWAPNHRRTEPWRFVVIEGEARSRFAAFMLNQYKLNTKEELHNERKMKDIVDKCELSNKIILIGMKPSHLVPEWEDLAATAMAVQNMWLMCTSMEIGAYWSSPGAISKMHEFTDLGEEVTCYGIFYMGKLKTDLFEGQRNPMDAKVKFIQN